MPSQQQQAFNFRFLTHMELSNVCSETFGREAALLLLGGCPDLESIIIDFKEKAWFFSDFFLDEVLCGNPMGRLESFRLRNVLMTLISALRLLNSRPKLTTIGHVLDWDVEPSEIETFGQIVKRAQSLHLLHEVTFLWHHSFLILQNRAVIDNGKVSFMIYHQSKVKTNVLVYLFLCVISLHIRRLAFILYRKQLEMKKRWVSTLLHWI